MKLRAEHGPVALEYQPGIDTGDGNDHARMRRRRARRRLVEIVLPELRGAHAR